MHKVKAVRISKTLRHHLRAITAQKATWRNYQKAATLLSDQAEACWRANGSKSAALQHQQLQLALSYLDYALNWLSSNSPKQGPHYWLATSTVICELALLMSRLARTIKDYELAQQAIDSLRGDAESPAVRQRLDQMAQTYPAYKQQCLHMAAIAGMVEFRLHCGHVFGFLADTHTSKAMELEDDTLSRFQGMSDQASLDKERAYRSFLLHAALFNEWRGDRPRQYRLALDALASALQFRDVADGVRAVATLIGGKRLRCRLSRVRLSMRSL